MNELVFNSDKGIPVTTSLLVAEKFGKEHNHVMRDIRNIIGSAQNWTHPLFFESEYTHPQNGQNYTMFVMNRDGFSLLVMGFTGSDALKFKLEFLEAFNKMESLLKSDDYILARSQEILTQRIALLKQHVEKLEATTELQQKELQQAAPKVQYHDEVLQAENTHTSTTIAKELGISAQELHKRLNKKGVVFFHEGHWVLYAKYQNSGYAKTRTHTYETIEDGQVIKKTSITTVWTEKGREFIHKVLKTETVAA